MTSAAFHRDRFTWLAYAMLGYFAYLQAAPGVAMPLLRSDLDLSYTLGGLHISALAGGMVVAGLSSDRAVARWGRPAVFWGGGAGMAAGSLLLVVGQHPAITVLGTALMGLLGTLLLATVQSGLADHHGARRAIALTESNVVASASTILPPLLIGGFTRVGLGWRAAFVTAILVWLLLRITERRTPVPASRARPIGGVDAGGRLPRRFWLNWAALVLAVAAEWSVISWGAEFLVSAADLRKADASATMTLFFVAMMLGRGLGSRLVHRADVVRLWFVAMAVAVGGFLVFWLAPAPALIIGGLFVAGLGMANIFPFLLTIGVGSAPEQADRASARITLGAGLAILLAPQALGTLADAAGIRAAFAVTLTLLLVAILAGALAQREPAGQSAAGAGV